MGTVKYTGPVASFHCPTNAEIRSLKVHFSPRQEGTGDPSPENVREIVGWDGVEVYSYPDVNISIDNIPNEYKKINYLQSSGTQYIDTLVSGGNSTTHPKYEIIFTPLNSTLSFQQYFAGERAPQGIPKLYKDNIRSACVVQKAGIGTKDCNIAYNEVSKIVASEDLCEVNGIDIEFDSSEALNGWGSSSWYIFNSHSESTLASNMRLYGLKMWSDEVLIRNFIPCRRKSDNKPGMYDTVSGEFFTNQGTGEFICGPDIGETVEYEFGVLGKNKVPFLVDSKTISTQTNGNAGWCNVWKIPNKNLKYTYSAYIDNTNNTNTANITVWLKNIDNTSYVDGTVKSGTRVAAGAIGRSTITLDASTLSNTYYFVFGITSFIKSGETASCTFSNPMVEIGDTATAYEPYDPKHTVYGGWVDLISGEVCEEWKSIALESLDWSGSGNRARASNSIDLEVPSYNVAPDFIAEKYYAASYSTQLTNHPSGIALGSTGFIAYYDGETLPNGKMVYKLSEPATYHLAPTELQTFLGQNNIWSNADYVEVEYDLHETQDILARKQFIMANQPHIVKPAAAPLQNFVTDMAAALKECKVYFNPIQEGEGDPSPENVRAIGGWTGIEVYRTGKNLMPPTQLESNWKWSKVFIKGGTKVTCSSITPQTGNDQVTFYQKDKITKIDYWTLIQRYQDGTRGYRSFTVRNGDVPYDAVWWKFPYGDDAQLELGTTPTDYEPYQGQTLPIDWTAEAGTVYGGYVDLVKGEVWETWGLKDLGTVNWSKYNNRAGVFCTAAMNEFSSTSKLGVLCNKYASTHDNVTAQADKTIGDAFQLRLRSFAIYDTDYADATVAEFKTAMSGVFVAYPLATPAFLTTLTPTQLKTLRGTNNVWSNAGDITLSYWKH